VLSKSLARSHPGGVYLCGPPGMVGSTAEALVSLGIGADDFGALWDAVRGEMAERIVGPEHDSSDLDPQTTVAEAAKALAALLAEAGYGEDDE